LSSITTDQKHPDVRPARTKGIRISRLLSPPRWKKPDNDRELQLSEKKGKRITAERK